LNLNRSVAHARPIKKERPMDVARHVFRLIQLGGDWYWRLDIKNDDGLIGPFLSSEEAQKDARERHDE
jgi:hypothetical protein